MIISLLSLIFGSAVFAQTATNVYLDPATQNIAPGTLTTVTAKIANTPSTGAYQLTINYNPLVVEAKTATDSGWLGSTGRSVTPLITIDNTSGKITLAAYSLGNQAGPAGIGDLVTITFQGINAGHTDLTISGLAITDPSGSDIAITNTPAAITVLPPATPSPTPTPAPTIVPSPSPSPTPTPPTSPLATMNFIATTSAIFDQQEFTVDLNISTNVPITGLDAVILFDPTKLSAISISDRHLLPNTPKSSLNNGNGTVKISQVTSTNQSYTGSGTFATVRFKALGVGPKSLRLDWVAGKKNESNVIALSTGADILVQPQDLNFTVSDHATLEVIVSPVDVAGTLSIDGSNWKISDGIDNLIGQTVTFSFKADTFLKRKVTLTIHSGINTLDLGSLIPGDLNNDGIINNADLAISYDQWFGPGTADFNKDGVVNGADYWTLLTNFLKVDD